jgi:hypothetical protein
VLGPTQRRSGKRFMSHANRAAKFAHNRNKTGCETLAQRRMIARICSLFKAHTGRRSYKATGHIILKPCYLSRVDHYQKIRTRKQRTYVGKYSFVIGPLKARISYLQAYWRLSFFIKHFYKKG